MPGPCCRVRRAASSPSATILRALIYRGSPAPFSQQGRAVAAHSTCRWSHFAYAISWRTSSSVCASLISDRQTGRLTCDQEAVAHRTGLVGRPDAQQRQRKDAIAGPRIAQEPAITPVHEELARKPRCANAPGPPHAKAQILECLDREAGPLGELAIFDLVPHARQASLATDRLQEAPNFPGTRITPGEPGADRQASAGPERPIGLVEEMLFLRHMLEALHPHNMVKPPRPQPLATPIPPQQPAPR